MIDKKFFKKYQKQLVWFINTQIGRWFFCVDKEIRNIHEVFPNALSYNKCYILVKGEWRVQQKTCFRTHNKYAKLINYRLRHFQRLGYLIPALLKPELGFAMLMFIPLTVTTFYPAAGYAYPVDGTVSETGVNVSWATLIAAAGNDVAVSSDAVSLARIDSFTTTDQFARLGRTITLFNTSSIPDSDETESATLSYYGYWKSDSFSPAIAPDINVYSSNPAATNSLENGDFDTLGSTAFSTIISYAGFTIDAYNDWALNASGLAAISKTGTTKLGTRNANYDVAASAPTWSSGKSADMGAYSADSTGTAKDPKLVVTHSEAVAEGNSIFFGCNF